jgi:hypothetical protein
MYIALLFEHFYIYVVFDLVLDLWKMKSIEIKTKMTCSSKTYRTLYLDTSIILLLCHATAQ